MRVAYQGEPGCYSEQAVWQRFAGKGAAPIGFPSFTLAVDALLHGKADALVLPVENSRIGAIEPAQAAIDAVSDQVDERARFWMPIELCLIGAAGTRLESVRSAHSHPAALRQVATFLNDRGIEPVESADTAGAVREVKERAIAGEAAIASRRAAALHGMEVLAHHIEDETGNRTRFAVYFRAHK